jgi:aspartate dehydrogenase
MRKVAVIGYGAIGAAIAKALKPASQDRLALSAVLVRPDGAGKPSKAADGIPFVTNMEALLATDPDIVVEAASHEAVAQFGVAVLSAGKCFHVLSAGALTDDRLRRRLEEAAAQGNARLLILAGALAGFDGLLSMRASGLRSVKYTCTKPVGAWRGTIAESLTCLDDVKGRQIIFSGNAREAANAFPQNANLAAAVALAGLGFERTRVELIADSESQENSARLEAESESERLDVSFVGLPFSGNPKSSRVTAMSAIAALEDQARLIGFS